VPGPAPGEEGGLKGRGDLVQKRNSGKQSAAAMLWSKLVHVKKNTGAFLAAEGQHAAAK